MHILSTARLHLRELIAEDSAFIHQLLSDPDWLRFIGDRGVRSVDDARDYITGVYMEAYARHGYGLWAVVPRGEQSPVGICGLVRREWLDVPDLGFAFLPAGRGRGLAREAAVATLQYARDTLGLQRVLAITSPENAVSQGVLLDVGFTPQGTMAKEGEREVSVFACELRDRAGDPSGTGAASAAVKSV